MGRLEEPDTEPTRGVVGLDTPPPGLPEGRGGGTLGFGPFSACPKRPLRAHPLPRPGDPGQAHHAHRPPAPPPKAGRQGPCRPQCGRPYHVPSHAAYAAAPRAVGLVCPRGGWGRVGPVKAVGVHRALCSCCAKKRLFWPCFPRWLR